MRCPAANSTGKERDSESGLDNFGARYGAPNLGRFISTDPSRLSVALEDPQSWNRYSYANNNPLRFVDRNGKWSTPVHGEIIDESLGSKLSKSDREWIKQGSAYVDGDQSLAGAPKHGLHRPFQSPDEAKQIGEAFVSTQIDAAVRAQLEYEENGATGWSPVALFDFGMAQHTPADADSPWHDQWNNIWWGQFEPIESIAHGIGEAVLGPYRDRAKLTAVLDVSRLWVRFNMALIDERWRREEEDKRRKQKQAQEPLQ